MRLIDANDALQLMDELLRSPYANDKIITPQYIAVRDTIHLVKALCIGKSLTVDAAPVVHCRDCRWGQEDDAGVIHCHKYHIHKKTDGYCDDGARMDLPEGEEAQNDG